MKSGRRKETPPDHIPVTRISSFKLFNPLFNSGTFHDAATGMAGKSIFHLKWSRSLFSDRGLTSWSVCVLSLISAIREIKGGLSWNRHRDQSHFVTPA